MAWMHSARSMTAALAALGMVTSTGAALAQEKMRLSEAQCESAWNKANPDNKAKISESQARAYISDVSAVNKDGDGTVERSEFMRACDMGLVKSSATTGEGSGSSGSGTYEKRGGDDRPDRSR